ncbi:MAG: hypothetical protein Kow006_19140 [Gammaproteobacteria bacterium]
MDADIVRALAEYAMRGPTQAALVAGGFAALSLALPPLSYLSSATVALVTLRKGARDGGFILLAAILSVGMLVWASTGKLWFAATLALLLWLPVWLLSLVLRYTVSLATLFQAAALVAALLVVGMHLTMGNPTAAWQEVLMANFGTMMQQAGVPDTEALLGTLAGMMTGVVAAALMVSYLLSVLLARWWQAMLYNPGGFQKEFHQLRLGRGMAIAALGVFAASWLLSGGAGLLARDLGTVALVVYLFQGLAIVHGVVKLLHAHIAWLAGLYFVMIVALPQLAMVLAVLGIGDTWTDIRARLEQRKSPDTDLND